jgi:hypothetical protein
MTIAVVADLKTAGQGRAKLARDSESALKCPSCGIRQVLRVDSRPDAGHTTIRRRCACLACNFRWTTREVIDGDDLSVAIGSPPPEFMDLWNRGSELDRELLLMLARRLTRDSLKSGAA